MMFKKYILNSDNIAISWNIFEGFFFQEDYKVWFSLVAHLSLGVNQILTLVFNAIKGILQNNVNYANELDLYKNIKDLYPNLKKMTYSQFVFCLYVFFEIGVISKNTQFGYVIKINNQVKTNLENSNFYNKIKLIQKIK